jgi:ATP-dependent Clp protease ATP-binding subunit ClpA
MIKYRYRFSAQGRETLDLAYREAQKNRHACVDSGHLLSALLSLGAGAGSEGFAFNLLRYVNASFGDLTTAIEQAYARRDFGEHDPQPTKGLDKIVIAAHSSRSRLSCSGIGPYHLSRGLAFVVGTPAHEILHRFNYQPYDIRLREAL